MQVLIQVYFCLGLATIFKSSIAQPYQVRVYHSEDTRLIYQAFDDTTTSHDNSGIASNKNTQKDIIWADKTFEELINALPSQHTFDKLVDIPKLSRLVRESRGTFETLKKFRIDGEKVLKSPNEKEKIMGISGYGGNGFTDAFVALLLSLMGYDVTVVLLPSKTGTREGNGAYDLLMQKLLEVVCHQELVSNLNLKIHDAQDAINFLNTKDDILNATENEKVAFAKNLNLLQAKGLGEIAEANQIIATCENVLSIIETVADGEAPLQDINRTIVKLVANIEDINLDDKSKEIKSTRLKIEEAEKELEGFKASGKGNDIADGQKDIEAAKTKLESDTAEALKKLMKFLNDHTRLRPKLEAVKTAETELTSVKETISLNDEEEFKLSDKELKPAEDKYEKANEILDKATDHLENLKTDPSVDVTEATKAITVARTAQNEELANINKIKQKYNTDVLGKKEKLKSAEENLKNAKAERDNVVNSIESFGKLKLLIVSNGDGTITESGIVDKIKKRAELCTLILEGHMGVGGESELLTKYAELTLGILNDFKKRNLGKIISIDSPMMYSNISGMISKSARLDVSTDKSKTKLTPTPNYIPDGIIFVNFLPSYLLARTMRFKKVPKENGINKNVDSTGHSGSNNANNNSVGNMASNTNPSTTSEKADDEDYDYTAVITGNWQMEFVEMALVEIEELYNFMDDNVEAILNVHHGREQDIANNIKKREPTPMLRPVTTAGRPFYNSTILRKRDGVSYVKKPLSLFDAPYATFITSAAA